MKGEIAPERKSLVPHKPRGFVVEYPPDEFFLYDGVHNTKLENRHAVERTEGVSSYVLIRSRDAIAFTILSGSGQKIYFGFFLVFKILFCY